MKFTVNKTIHIYGQKKPDDQIPPGHDAQYFPAQVSAEDDGWGEGPPDKDTEIEAPEARRRFTDTPDFGELSISIQPGDDRIGELYFNIQYEGPNQKGERCLNGLNEALPNVRDWIFGLLLDTTNPETPDGKESEIEVQCATLPCPKGAHRIEVGRIVSREIEPELARKSGLDVKIVVKPQHLSFSTNIN